MAEVEYSKELVERYRKVSSATVYGGVRRLGYDVSYMKGVHARTPGAKLVGRARTLRFVPPRPDIKRETQRGENSPEYVAMGSCQPGDVAVFDAMGKSFASIGGDVKILQLKMRGAEGLVTDGAIRDLGAVSKYPLKLFSGGRTGAVGEPDVWPYEANCTIQCGGVAVRPGDLIVGDDDGVVVVAAEIAAQVIDWVEEHEAVEEFIIDLIEKEGVAPGKYYPISEATVEMYRKSKGK
jgi:regulator of RNase E activity RraA